MSTTPTPVVQSVVSNAAAGLITPAPVAQSVVSNAAAGLMSDGLQYPHLWFNLLCPMLRLD